MSFVVLNQSLDHMPEMGRSVSKLEGVASFLSQHKPTRYTRDGFPSPKPGGEGFKSLEWHLCHSEEKMCSFL